MFKLKLELDAKNGKKIEKEVSFELSDDEIEAVVGGLAPPAPIKTHDYDDEIKGKT